MKLDDFESAFRSALKADFQFEPAQASRFLLVTDLAAPHALQLEGQVRTFLSAMDHADKQQFNTLNRDDWSDIPSLLAAIGTHTPDVIVTYRNLFSAWTQMPHTLGSVLDVLSQDTPYPIMILPTMAGEHPTPRLPDHTHRVMVVTNHLTGDSHLVNWAAHFCDDDGTLYLTHVEDLATFEQYADVLARIPGHDTETLVDSVRKKLMSLPSDYINRVIAGLAEAGIHETVIPIVAMGHPVHTYERLVLEHEVDLIVMNSGEERQAMSELSHALAMEITEHPLLLL
jgi:hypothetical protein